MQTVKLIWDRGCAEIRSLGAMLAPVDFKLPDGHLVSPMHIAPWSDEPDLKECPSIIRGLRGEWPCVPFGMVPKNDLPNGWPALSAFCAEGRADDLHGYGSNNDWELDVNITEKVFAYIQYPQTSDIRALSREITSVSGAAKLDISLSIKVRRDTKIPLGLHPTFRLPKRSGAMRLVPGGYDQVWTYPGDLASPRFFQGNTCFSDICALSNLKGNSIDATRLPFDKNCEELLFLTKVDGQFALENLDENYRIILKWNTDHFPSVLIWISNFGRQATPWNGRHLAVGIEPVCSAFDFGTSISNSENPIAQSGIATTMPLFADQGWQTRYSIEVEPL